MASSILITADHWRQIRLKLAKDYSWKPSVLAIRAVCLRELGFTTRYHHFIKDGVLVEQIYLDFWDDKKESFFRLKYL